MILIFIILIFSLVAWFNILTFKTKIISKFFKETLNEIKLNCLLKSVASTSENPRELRILADLGIDRQRRM